MKHKNNIIKLCLGIFLAFTMALPAIAQKTQTFKGVVVDTTGEPIIGASVKVVGTTTGTITDLDGKFMVVVPSGKQVEISYIGYITQVLSDFKQTKIELILFSIIIACSPSSKIISIRPPVVSVRLPISRSTMPVLHLDI